MSRAGYLFVLHIILAMFSVSGIFSKLAAAEQMLSPRWIMYYGAVLLFLFVYAIAWQQIIKKMPIVTAYANKAAMVIWGIIWGRIIFKENITPFKIVGAVIIIVGVYLVVTGDDDMKEDKQS
jgi:drug/metabolite transporter (DMT)-like permease